MIGWIAPNNERCGVSQYSQVLFHELKKSINVAYLPIGSDIPECDLYHIQHEYGLFGGKNPPFYHFPKFIRNLKKKNKPILLTAHTVLPIDYHFPTENVKHVRLRKLINSTLLFYLRRIWNEKTFDVNHVIVHSELQKSIVESYTSVSVIPHFVPDFKSWPQRKEKKILVFGFFSKDKGQDIVIRALSYLPDYTLVCAGGLRQVQDAMYYEYCKKLIVELG